MKLLACVCALVAATPAAAQERPLPDLTLEELMRVEIRHVFGASERLQPVTEAPSSVTIVTADDIQRYGYRTLADILRGARGFYVSDDRNYSYLGTRGFARPGDYNTRILLLVDGHRLNDNVYDQAWIGGELAIDPATFERVEIIRGPASSLYGTSAFFAVINIVTRGGTSMGSPAVHLETGSLGTQLVRASGGRRLSSRLDLSFSASYERSDGLDRLYFPAYDGPETNGGVAADLDAERGGSLFARVDFRGLSVVGVYGRRDKDVPTASFGTIFNSRTPSEHTTDVRAFAGVAYGRAFGATRVDLRGSFDRPTYTGRYPYLFEDGVSVLNDGSLGTRLQFGGRVTRPLPGRQTVTAGIDRVGNLQQDQRLEYLGSGPDAIIDRASTQLAFFIQDDIKIRPWLMVDAGLRHDSYQSFTRTSPRGAVIVLPSVNASFKYLYGRAFRAPNMFERFYYPRLRELVPESIDTHELVWEQYVGDSLRTSASVYRYSASRLISLMSVTPTEDSPDGLAYVNGGQVDAVGMEVEAEVRTKSGLQAVASYALQDTHQHDFGEWLSNSPRHLLNARISVPGPRRSTVAWEGRLISARLTAAGTTVGAHAVANLTARVPVSRAVTLHGSVRNLLDSRYFDPASDEHLQDAIQQNGRTFRVGLTWTFRDR